ncbi:MAG: helix-turn-helix transcriptional regulator [Oscillospiraceae bacterium]|nr:helix-turn-helix transcriptional regulator [Oscillospiraceae bacterium]
MSMNYNKLWKLLIDRGINKTELRLKIGMGTSTLAKMSANENVSLDIIEKICELLQVQPGDIMEYVSNVKDDEQSPLS